MAKLRVMTVFGTRPEAIKMAPVLRELQRHSDDVKALVATTGQHREMLGQVLDVFDVQPDFELDIMTENQTLAGVTSRVVSGLDALFSREPVDLLLVQGDTTTAFASALAAYYHRIPVGHIEAGLRTGDRYNPFPEELNRRLACHLSTIHFAPTKRAESNLLAEGVSEDDIVVTGNTVIDALLWVVDTLDEPEAGSTKSGIRRLFVTAHRRESWGRPLEEVCYALLDIVDRYDDVEVTFPVHLNPNVRKTVNSLLGQNGRITLTEPMSYVDCARAMVRSHLVLTDSGGIQEEAPSLGKPVLVLRDHTERQEGVEGGTCSLVGPHRHKITAEVGRLLDDPSAYEVMAKAINPYGDGYASQRIVQALVDRFAGQTTVEDPQADETG